MYFKSKTTSLMILGLTSLICSRAMFAFFNDPEGPNLLVVIGMAAIVYLLSLALYVFGFSVKGLRRLILAVSTQIIIVVALYFLLN